MTQFTDVSSLDASSLDASSLETEFSFVSYKLYENVNASFVLKIGGPYEAQAAAIDARRSQKGLQDTIHT